MQRPHVGKVRGGGGYFTDHAFLLRVFPAMAYSTPRECTRASFQARWCSTLCTPRPMLETYRNHPTFRIVPDICSSWISHSTCATKSSQGDTTRIRRYNEKNPERLQMVVTLQLELHYARVVARLIRTAKKCDPSFRIVGTPVAVGGRIIPAARAAVSGRNKAKQLRLMTKRIASVLRRYRRPTRLQPPPPARLRWQLVLQLAQPAIC